MKKWLLLLITFAWLTILFMPIAGKKLGKLFTYNSSLLQTNHKPYNSNTYKATSYGKVEIGYNELGVPHIFADNENAAAWGMGFAQARDRLFQMDMMTRTVSGRLSEVVGSIALPRDRFWRKFRFTHLADNWLETVKQTDPDVYAYFVAYTEGINAYLQYITPNEMPMEYKLLGFKPQKFTPQTLFLLIRYMDFTLDYGDDDLAYTQIAAELDSSLLAFYYPFINPYGTPIYPELDGEKAKAFTQEKIEDFALSFAQESLNLRAKKPDIGSNNWAISPSKSKTGNAYLCNDTHLDVKLPSTWYEMHVSVKGKMRHGFSIAGAPFIISGFNDSIAWGMTNTTWNLVDFYSLDHNKDTYTVDGKEKAFAITYDTIKVKDQEPVLFKIVESDFGVMDSIAGKYLAVNWIGTLPSREDLCFYNMQRAQNINDAYEAVQYFQHPPQNFILADCRGNIGLVSSGSAAMHKAPVRTVIAARNISDRVDYKPMHKLLNWFNPSRGYVYSANQNHTLTALSAQLQPGTYAASSRGKRIDFLLSSQEKLGAQELAELQLDIVDLEWEILKAKTLVNIPADMATILKNWNGKCDTNSIAATLFYNYKLRLYSEFCTMLNPNLSLGPQDELLYYLVANKEQLPVPNGNIAVNTLISTAWNNSIAELRASLGPDYKTWLYSRYHQADIRHIIDRDGALAAMSIQPFGVNGSNRTVNVASELPAHHFASMRTIIELNPNGITAQLCLTGGQSGRFDSPNYHDQINDWKSGKYHNIDLKRVFKKEDYSCWLVFDK